MNLFVEALKKKVVVLATCVENFQFWAWKKRQVFLTGYKSWNFWKIYISKIQWTILRQIQSSFSLVEINFLRNYKADNYSEQVESMLSSFRQLGCKMSIKVLYLDNLLDRFSENLGDLGEEQVERFHQDLRPMEERYRDNHMMMDCYWFIQREYCGEAHSKKSLKPCFWEMS